MPRRYSHQPKLNGLRLLLAGKADVREVMDLGWLYNRAFADADGHVFEAVWMDAGAMPSA